MSIRWIPPSMTAALICALATTVALGASEQAYPDGPTSQWFKNLSSAYVRNCCDQADCKRAMSDFRNGTWWARSNRTGKWVPIEQDQITQTVSIFPDAVLCEGDPFPGSDEPRIYCFAPPPIGF